jgi:2,3-bisphosphoglycerate-dependent phosphoglycerate mutase
MEQSSPTQMSELYLLRHGESTYNRDNRFTGWVDAPLNEQGIAEMETAGRLLQGHTIDLAFSSALSRTRDSAIIALRTAGLSQVPVIATDCLNERRYGDLEGLNKAEIAEQYGAEQVRQWRRSFTAVPPGGESLAVASKRIISFYESDILPKLRSGLNVLVCAHGNTIRAIVKRLEHLSDDALMNLEVATGELLVYTVDSSGDEVRTVKIG